MELVLEQQGSCRVEGGGSLEGPGWSSTEAGGIGRRRVLQSRGSALVCSVCTVDNNADIDAGCSRLGPGLPGLEHYLG